MSLELVPRLRGLRFGLTRFSGDGGRSAGFKVCRRRPMTVPNRLRPPNRRGSKIVIMLMSFEPVRSCGQRHIPGLGKDLSCSAEIPDTSLAPSL